MKNMALIIDDDRSERRMIASILQSRLELPSMQAENGHEGLEVLKQTQGVKLIILDLDMPVMDGREALKLLQKNYPHIPVIVLTGSTDTQDAVDAMKRGASDFLPKPLETERLTASARNGLRLSLLSNEVSRLKRKNDGAMVFADLIGCDAGLAKTVKIGRKASDSQLPVLITGETGTGKEMFARAIHGESDRGGHDFIAVNCGAIPEKLVESILFGHEKGAFTGATHKSLGKFQEAAGGTIFLDEVGELPPDAQVKLLRVLQQKEVEPVGAGKSVQVDVRVISATNRDLAQEVKEGRFREDLYFRLNVLGIHLPPLQVRPQDIEDLSHYFIQSYCASHGTPLKPISEAALLKLQKHDWPGNVRELENSINRAAALSEQDTLGVDDFTLEPYNNVETGDTDSLKNVILTTKDDGSFKAFKELEHEIIRRALAHHDNNMSQTARVLGIAKSTLYAKLNEAIDKKSA